MEDWRAERNNSSCFNRKKTRVPTFVNQGGNKWKASTYISGRMLVDGIGKLGCQKISEFNTYNQIDYWVDAENQELWYHSDTDINNINEYSY